MSEKEVLEEKIQEKKKEEKNEMKDYVDKMLNQSMKEMEGLHKAHEKHAEEKHNHATHSSEKFCPECGDFNPDYKEDQVVCEHCEKPVGTQAEVDSGKVKYCRNCGHGEGK